MKKQFELPVIESAGRASQLIQMQMGHRSDGGVGAFSKSLAVPAIEIDSD